MSTKNVFLMPFMKDDVAYLQDKDGNLFRGLWKEEIEKKYVAKCGKNFCIRVYLNDNGTFAMRKFPVDYFKKKGTAVTKSSFNELYNLKDGAIKCASAPAPAIDVNMSEDKKKILDIMAKAPSLKPELLKMTDINWKYMVRSMYRGHNIMVTGAAGCGKTFSVQCLAKAFPERQLFSINLGSTQDPRAALIGNTHYSKESGTYFSESIFVKAIQTPNAIVLLDELSRAHPEAMNILMPVLDPTQRFMRLEEADGSPLIKVAEGVCFIATANIGNEYTATRVLDRALLDRFDVIEMPMLNAKDEIDLLTKLTPELSAKKIKAIAEIAVTTRNEIKTDNSKISTILSTRATVELASLMNDGFTLVEAAEVAIFPFFPDEGGVDSERTFIKQVIQKFADVDKEDNGPEETKAEDEAPADDTVDIPLSDEKPF